MDNIETNINAENTDAETNHTFKSIEDFRKNATETDYKKLEEYILAQKNKQSAFPYGPYQFSYSSASKELREKGYLPIKRKAIKDNNTMNTTANTNKSDENHNQNTSKTLTIIGGKNRVYKTRSYPIDEEVLARFDNMAAYYEDCSKKALLSEILNQGLKYYGF